jgi:hypothetical protein
VDEAILAAMDAAWAPYAFVFDGLDPSSEESSLAYAPDRFGRTDAMIESWASDRTVEWITPEGTTRWEGLAEGQA